MSARRSLEELLAPAVVDAIEELVAEIVAGALREHGVRERRRKFVTVGEAARELGLSERAVRAQVHRGRLEARWLGTRILVDLDSIEDVANRGGGC